MKAKKFMSTDLITINKTTLACDIAQLFARHRIGSLPVIQDGKPVGLVLRRHFLKLFLPTYVEFMDIILYLKKRGNLETLIWRASQVTAEDIMATNLFTINENVPFEEVVATLFEKNADHLLVTKEGKLVGIISRTDITKALGGMLKDFCKGGEGINEGTNDFMGISPS